MLQGIAYAIVAGLPPQFGLYASIMGAFGYVVFGSTKVLCRHRRRILVKAKVVTALWGTEFFQFLVALAVFHLENLKKRMNCTRMI